MKKKNIEEGSEYIWACWYAEHKTVPNCWKCSKKKWCDMWSYVCDLTIIRVTCSSCHKSTREEHVKFCPFCGVRI